MSAGGLALLAVAAGLWAASIPSWKLCGAGIAAALAIFGQPIPSLFVLLLWVGNPRQPARTRIPYDEELADLLETWKARLRAGMDIGSALADPGAAPPGSPAATWLLPLQESLLAGRPLSEGIGKLDPNALPKALRPAWTGLCGRITAGLPVSESIADLAAELRAHHARRLEAFARTAPLRMLIPQWLLFLGVFAAALLPILMAQGAV